MMTSSAERAKMPVTDTLCGKRARQRVRVELRRQEREREAMAQRYSVYAQTTENPITFEQFIQVMQQLSE